MAAKLVRAVALSRRRAPTFSPIRGDEHVLLRMVGPWARCLWIELLALCNHRTGRVSTSWAQLLSHLDWDGGAKVPRCTLKQARTAAQQLLDVGLIRVHETETNQADGCLIFWVQKRQGFSASADSKGRVKGQGLTPGKSGVKGQGQRAGGSGAETHPAHKAGGESLARSISSAAVDNSDPVDGDAARSKVRQLRDVIAKRKGMK